MNKESAIAMSKDTKNSAAADEGADLWSVTIKGVPMGARYSYLTADPTGLGEARPLLNYKLQVHAGHAAAARGDALVADDTTHLVRFEVNKGGSDVRVTGSAPALGGWDYDKALKLERATGGDNKWS